MNKKTFIAIIVVILLVAAIGTVCFFASNTTRNTTVETPVPEVTTDKTETNINNNEERLETLPVEVSESQPKETQPEETQPEEPTIPTVLVEELLQSEDTVLVKKPTSQECDIILSELGFDEVFLSYEILENGTPVCKPVSLEYNDKAFCLRFSYYDYNLNRDGEGWVLYGLKTDSFVNITSVDPKNYEYFILDTFRADKANTDEAKHVFGELYPRLEDWICTSPSSNTAMYYSREYYPYTGNLYAYYRESSEDTASSNRPFITLEWREYLVKQWVNTPGLQSWRMTNYEINFRSTYFYENGMTMKDWADSIYNVDGWFYAEGDITRWLINEKEGRCILIPNYSTGEMWLLGHGREDAGKTSLNDYETLPIAQAIKEGYDPNQNNK